MKLTHVEAAILVGGASSRMGRDKARLEIGGVPLVQRVATVLQRCVTRVRVVIRPGGAPPLDLPYIEDRHPQRAPIVGVHAALAACESSAVLVTACDLPEITPSVILMLLALVPREGGSDVVVAQGSRGLEPLLAVYRPRILPELEARIERGELALRSLLEAVDTLVVPEAELRRVDPELRSLRNLNRPEDLEGAAG